MSCSIQVGTLCGEASGIWICSNFEGRALRIWRTFRWFGSNKVWRWSGAMPGIPSTLGHILHSSTTTAPSSIDFNFFTNTALFDFLINFIWRFPLSCSSLISRLLSLKLSLRQSAYKFRRRISNSKLLNNQTFLSQVLLKMKAKSFTKKKVFDLKHR